VARMTPRKAALLACEYALSKKAEDVLMMDLRKLTDIADYFVICSGTSEIQVKAIADAVAKGLEGHAVSPQHIEGYTSLRWVLLDYVSIVVHVFHVTAREYYDLESFWGDAPSESFE
jgi:ribosome-associated protein